MKFGKELLQSQIPEWSGHYIPYKTLKRLISNALNKSQLNGEPNDDCIKDEGLHQNSNFNQEGSSELLSDLLETKNEINNLLHFADLNIKAANKILKKFDKKLNRNLKDDYLNTKVNILPLASSSALVKILGSIEQWIREVEHVVVDNNNVAHNNLLSNQNLIMENTVLLDVIKNDDASALRNLIVEKVSNIEMKNNGVISDNIIINPTNPEVQKLYKACWYPALKCIELLLNLGVNIHGEEDINKRSLIHKLVINGGILPKENITTSPVSSPISIRDDPRIIACILKSLPSDSQALSQDVYDKSPLHYAAIKGLVRITQTLLEYLKKTRQFSLKEADFNDHVWFDGDGYSPLFYATINNKVQVLECIISILQINGEKVDAVSNVRCTSLVPKFMNSTSSTAAQTLLAISCKFGHCSVTKLLLDSGANPDVQDEDDETPLHLASRAGFTECCLMLINEKNANKEIREKYYGWTPLFLAVIEGHEETVAALIKSGVNFNIVDNSGWTPHMHALFRGHLNMKDILRPPRETILSSISANHNIMASPQDNRSQQESSTEVERERKYLQNQSLIFVTLGTTDSRTDVTPIELNSTLKTPVSIVIWAKNATGEKVTIDLPIKDSSSIDPLINRFTQWKSLSTKVIGHRGSGANDKTWKLQLGENTLDSFKAAAIHGAEYVEFDCQLTKDLVPVIYHDWNVTETGIDIPMHSVTLKQFLNLKKIEMEISTNDFNETDNVTSQNSQNFQNSQNDGDTDNTPNSSSFKKLKRANSMGSILNKAKSRRIDENNNGKLKGNGIGTIQSPFIKLEDTFKNIPINIGFNIEVKYPMIDEAEEFELPTFYTELNIFCDKILECVYTHSQPERKIIFSSFHPETCLMLAFKQASYPVFFLTDCGITRMADARCNSVQAAIRFANFAGLSGIVTNCEPIIEAPGLVKVIKNAGLLLFTYGTLNNIVANAQLQKRADVDAVIVDSVLRVYKGLQQSDNEDQINNMVN
ncbi:3018_t:CDS:10 [Gigaspora margarita]|uniref:3018_t:CDS:1 n=1 Tax=Gigaspora margarita TaxID=4874 RepID=A0ABN7U133_GIGMA|nr:3018_t:CDS:10 [Gigaspora margarita]